MSDCEKEALRSTLSWYQERVTELEARKAVLETHLHLHMQRADGYERDLARAKADVDRLSAENARLSNDLYLFKIGLGVLRTDNEELKARSEVARGGQTAEHLFSRLADLQHALEVEKNNFEAVVDSNERLSRECHGLEKALEELRQSESSACKLPRWEKIELKIELLEASLAGARRAADYWYDKCTEARRSRDAALSETTQLRTGIKRLELDATVMEQRLKHAEYEARKSAKRAAENLEMHKSDRSAFNRVYWEKEDLQRRLGEAAAEIDRLKRGAAEDQAESRSLAELVQVREGAIGELVQTIRCKEDQFLRLATAVAESTGAWFAVLGQERACEIDRFLADGKRVKAVKAVCEDLGVDLKSAKAVTDAREKYLEL